MKQQFTRILISEKYQDCFTFLRVFDKDYLRILSSDQVKVIHNSSILTAVGCCGLQLYSYGEIVSIPYWTDTWQPDSFYEKIASNRQRGLHTLCLLDIKVKEPTLESITKRKKEYMPPRFMSVNEAASQLIAILNNKIQAGHKDLGQ